LIHYSDLINSLFYTALTQAEIDHLMARLFDKDSPALQPASVHVPFSSENLFCPRPTLPPPNRQCWSRTPPPHLHRRRITKHTSALIRRTDYVHHNCIALWHAARLSTILAASPILLHAHPAPRYLGQAPALCARALHHALQGKALAVNSGR
jgi:hypothetical protein